MSGRTIYTCDRCHLDVEYSISVTRVAIESLRQRCTPEAIYDFRHYCLKDLCPECAKALEEFMNVGAR